jgi:hypothetical protein
MRRALLSLSLGLVILMGAATVVFAHGGHGGGGHGYGGGSRSMGWHGGGHGPMRGYGVRRGYVGGRHGNVFRHRGYRNWNRYCWFPRYRCYGYFCPDDGLWYYWYGPSNCYLPVSDMETSPPDDSVNAPPSLPPGATSVP